MAWILAAGEDRRVDPAYIAVIWLWIFAGTFWTACVIQDRGGHPAWALAFLFIAAVTVSIDRLTIDVAVVSLTAGVIWFADRERWRAAVLLCALSCLARESGPLIPAALVCWELTRCRFRLAIAFAGSAVPAFAWYAWVATRTTPGAPAGLLSAFPFGGLLTRLVSPALYHSGWAIGTLATVLDYAALAGIIHAVVYTVLHWHRLSREAGGWIAFASVGLIAAVSTQAVWEEAYAFARGFSPLLLIVWLDGFGTRRPATGVPLVLTAPRIGLQIGSQITNVARGILGL